MSESKRRGRLADFFIRLLKEKPLGTVGGIITLILILVAIFADVLAPYPHDEIHVVDRLQGSSAQYMLGTDQLGQDLLSRIIHGARVSLTVGLAATSLNVLIMFGDAGRVLLDPRLRGGGSRYGVTIKQRGPLLPAQLQAVGKRKRDLLTRLRHFGCINFRLGRHTGAALPTACKILCVRSCGPVRRCGSSAILFGYPVPLMVDCRSSRLPMSFEYPGDTHKISR